jgi:hypothetical protein
MDEMPSELIAEIARFLSHEDLYNFRLVNRNCGQSGQMALLSRLVFHASWLSIERIKRRSNHSEERHYVKTLVWDTDMWTLGNRVTSLDDFRSYAAPHHQSMDERIRDLERCLAVRWGLKSSEMATKYKSIVDIEIHHQSILYHKHTQEEAEVLDWILNSGEFRPLLGHFDKLDTRIVVNSRFALSEDQTVKERLTDLNSRHFPPAMSGRKLRTRGEGL